MNSCLRFAVVSLLISLSGVLRAQPAFVVDGQIPILLKESISQPHDLVVTPSRTLYVADTGNHRVVRITFAGTFSEVSFNGLNPELNEPVGLALDTAGNLYVTDVGTNRLIRLNLATNKAEAVFTAPTLNRPVAVACDPQGDLAVVNANSRNIILQRGQSPAYVFNTGETTLVSPRAAAFDINGRYLFVADDGNRSTEPAVYRFPIKGGTGTIKTPTGYQLRGLDAISLDALGNMYLLDGVGRQLISVPSSGNNAFLIPQTNFHAPSGLTLDPIGNFYVSDYGTGGSGTVTEFAYLNSARFGNTPVGLRSRPMTFNFAFYRQATVTAIRGIGGGVPGAEYLPAPGGTCALTTYKPTIGYAGSLVPAQCTLQFLLQPKYPGGRPGAVQLITSIGTASQPTYGVGLGAQLAVDPVTITTIPLPQGHPGQIAINAGEAQAYLFYGAPQTGVYAIPFSGADPVLLPNSVLTGFLTPIDLVATGSGDLLMVTISPVAIVKIPADFSPFKILNIPNFTNDLTFPRSMAIDPDGTLYIADLGPTGVQNPTPGFVWQITAAGVATKVNSSWFNKPYSIATDFAGNVYVADAFAPAIIKMAAGTLTPSYTTLANDCFTCSCTECDMEFSLTTDASGSLYYLAGASTGGPCSGDVGVLLPNGQSDCLPLVPPSLRSTTHYHLPFTLGRMRTAPSGNLYGTSGGNLVAVLRTQGFLSPPQSTPNPLPITLFNVGNQVLVGTNPAKLLSESGNGAGWFTFTPFAPTSQPPPLDDSQTCTPRITLKPGDACTLAASFKGQGKLTDILQFLTNAKNTNTVTFTLTGK